MRVSTTPLDDQAWEEIWNHLVQMFHTNSSPEGLEILFRNLLPPAERLILAKRLMIGVLFLAGWPAKDITASLSLSKATVYKYIALMEHSDDYKELLMPIAERISGQAEQSDTQPVEDDDGESLWSKLF